MREKCLPATQALLDVWAHASPILKEAFVVHQTAQYPSRDDMWSARGIEFFPIIGQNLADAIQYHPFESRFRKAAKASGFGDMADALTGALFEMADNVVQHSGATTANACPGLIGYYVSAGHVAFAICDAGRGVLASLRENPTWNGLTNSKAVLLSLLEQKASRHVAAPPYGRHRP